ncbi:MAG TPA: hypothetical protein VMW62_09195 [Chloroflexota bacterium]|nr:hypothetical protein [Chloroflexota bacterium]
MKGYTLVDLETGNNQGFYATEAEALANVVADFHRNGRESAEGLGLAAPTKHESLSGKVLVEKALAIHQRKSA